MKDELVAAQVIDVKVLDGDEKVYKDLNKMYLRILQDELSLRDLVDNNVLILYGPTGAGKSTLANAFIQGKENLKHVDGLYIAQKDLVFKGERIFGIGH